MAARIRFQIIVFLLIPFGLGSCVLFEEVEFDGTDSSSEMNDTALDYWDNGQCPGNTNTPETKVSNDCFGITLTGCCDANGNALYCHGGALYCKSCTSNGTTAPCSWSPPEASYWCTAADNGPEPSGTFLKACPAF